ncbi:UPF0182 family protein [Nocardioides aquiterrae]|uniref:UPF0182 protein GCM10009606_08780 n=1 Tax=Nocardioides aquiterrae TaxID=203799 RepID=A0ABP4EVP6_9ACTN
MSELFDEGARNDLPPPRSGSRRSRALIITAVVLVLAFLGLSTFANIYTDRLWYQDGGYSEVFTTLFWTKTLLFLVFGVLMAVVVGLNIYLAYRFRPFFRPSSAEQTGLDRYRDAVTPIRTWLLVGVAVVLGAFAGSSAIGEWRNFLMWRHGVPFGQQDVWFHKDIGFYVFDLPWLHYVVDFAMATLVISLIAAAVVHYLYGGIRLQTPRDRFSGAAQVQLSVLLGLFVLAKAADYWLDRFDLVNQGGSLITGMTYTDDHAVLPAKNILLGISVICAVLFFVNVWRRTWLLPSVGLALLAVSAILLGLIWPGIVQQFQVKPSEADKEQPYIKANIDATRAAYDLDKIQVSKVGDATIDNVDLDALDAQTASVPLVDPKLVSPTFEQVQQGRAYYSVADVLDVDHYDIEDTDRALVLGVRELDQAGIPDGDHNWSNLHTVYTHGSGVIAAYGNQRTTQDELPASTNDDRTQWAQGLLAGQDALSQATGGFNPRVYFGEQSPDYSVVGTAPGSKPVELDLPTTGTGGSGDGDTYTTYDGSGGVPIGSTFRQLLYAVKFGETNFLLSGRVNSNSEILYNRDPRTRVEKFAPWLTVDGDPYPVVADGKILWVLDGYTTTDRYPGAKRESFDTMTNDSLQPNAGLRTVPTDEINYMRNAVKATVDAYDGTVKLYAWNESDPILRTWEQVFPGVVQPKSEIPQDVMDHMRYPEDMFKVQRYQFARYHVTNPSDFYTGNQRWEVPPDPNAPSSLQPPYRMFVDQPIGSTDTPQQPVFSLTSTFVPYKKSNLAAFVTVDSEASSDDYGTIQVRELTDQSAKGPGQVANDFNSDSDVANQLALFNRSGGQVINGNLLTLPVGDGFLYVEPVYAVRAASSVSYPSLAFVLVSYNGEVGIGTSLPAALANALETSLPPSTGGGASPGGGNEGGGQGEPSGPIADQIRALLAQAQRHFDAADAAQRQGDTVTWARQMELGKELVQQAFELSSQLPKSQQPGSGQGSEQPSPSASPSASPSDTAG